MEQIADKKGNMSTWDSSILPTFLKNSSNITNKIPSLPLTIALSNSQIYDLYEISTQILRSHHRIAFDESQARQSILETSHLEQTARLDAEFAVRIAGIEAESAARKECVLE